MRAGELGGGGGNGYGEGKKKRGEKIMECVRLALRGANSILNALTNALVWNAMPDAVLKYIRKKKTIFHAFER